jgi:peptidoglycan/LPS O-acetylase OafA/YrhL
MHLNACHGVLLSPIGEKYVIVPPLVFVGRISYGIYLWHYLFIIVALPHISPSLIWIPALVGVGFAAAPFFLLERPLARMKVRWPALA